MVVLRNAAILVSVLALGCAPTPEQPESVIRSYFRALGRDPMRTLPLTTDAFHRSHELTLAGTSTDPSSVDRQQVAWLAVQREPQFVTLARSLSVDTTRVETGVDSALAVVRVVPGNGDAPPFEQRFALKRDRSGWRIDSVTQSGVSAPAAAHAYAAYPSRATRERISASPRRSSPF
jgi:hypothetical protein